MNPDPSPTSGPVRFCGVSVTDEQLALITRIVADYGGLTRTELANTVCELLDWTRPNGKLKTVECRLFLEQLHADAVLSLPTVRHKGAGKRQKIPLTAASEAGEPLQGSLKDFLPIRLRRVCTPEDRALFRQSIERYHYLGYRIPFGAHLSYLIEVTRPTPTLVGALQFSSPAWRIGVRDRWIGWSDTVRARHLQRIVNHSRFLILPSARIRYLASHVLSLAARELLGDWQAAYQVEPVLLETLVDIQRYAGACYRAANWLELGQTSGRGRQDRAHARHGAAPKRLFVYPLRPDAREQLCREAA